jgi:hypothetical protein
MLRIDSWGLLVTITSQNADLLQDLAVALANQ